MAKPDSETPALTSKEAIQRLLEDRPEKTRTYQTTPEALHSVQLDTKERLRSMDKYEIEQLAVYLAVPLDQLAGDFRVVDLNCPHCGRLISFLDFVHAAVGARQHAREELAEILTGRRGAWITIRGRDGGRPVICAECGQIARITDGYSEYSNNNYAYA